MNKNGFVPAVLIVGIFLVVGIFIYYRNSIFNEDPDKISQISPTLTITSTTSPTPIINPTITIDPTPTITETFQYQHTINAYEYGVGHYPAYDIELNLPSGVETSLDENEMNILIQGKDFSMMIGTYYEAYKVPLDDILTTVEVESQSFETNIVRVYYDGKYVYTDKYEESANGGCNGMEPQPTACLRDTVGTFMVNCTTQSDSGLNQCDEIFSSLVYNEV